MQIKLCCVLWCTSKIHDLYDLLVLVNFISAADVHDLKAYPDLYCLYSLPKTIEFFLCSFERGSRNRQSTNQRHPVYFL